MRIDTFIPITAFGAKIRPDFQKALVSHSELNPDLVQLNSGTIELIILHTL